MNNPVKESLAPAYTYLEYRQIVSDFLKKGMSSGLQQSEELTQYSLLNETRMNRLQKTIQLPLPIVSKLQSLRRKYIWLVIAEGWCGDAAQLLPVFEKMATVADNITLKIVFRDENESLINLFLTNGSKSIPKLIVLDATTLDVLADFGPRPKAATELVADYKKKHGVIDLEIKTQLQLWYFNDKGISTQNEVLALMEAVDAQAR